MAFVELAPVNSYLVLVIEVTIGLTLIGGAFAARTGHIRAHKYLQSAMVLVNIPIVLAVMVPLYLQYVLPTLPGGLTTEFNLLPTVMLVVGALSEGLGIYIILVAGTSLIPDRFRFRNYRLWMRTELVLWWSVLLLGMATFLVWTG